MARRIDVVQSEPYLFGRVSEAFDAPVTRSSTRTDALVRYAHSQFEQFCELVGRNIQEPLLQMLTADDPGLIADIIGQHATFSYQDKQKLLEQLHPVRRLEHATTLMEKELEVLRLENEISEKVQQSVDKSQRDYYLREQLSAIREELGEDADDDDADVYREKIRKLHLDDEIEEKLLKEVRRMAKQPPNSQEAALLRNYLDAVIELPWNTRTKERLDVRQARKILDADHLALKRSGGAILRRWPIWQLAPELPGQILCLVGPPGVGKTSVAISIARALNRKLARISLGGVHDEAEIRGHRKTYIGAMPGRIMAGISHAGSKNALLLLDEIDKLGGDYKGDPASALLEVLDAEQNSAFRDHYLEVPFDLHECMFLLTTANTTDTIARVCLSGRGGHRARLVYGRGKITDREAPPASEADGKARPCQGQRPRVGRGHA